MVCLLVVVLFLAYWINIFTFRLHVEIPMTNTPGFLLPSISDSKAQVQVVAYTTQEEELLKCFFKSTTSFASWNYLGPDGSLARDEMYTYVSPSGVSGPERGYEKFSIQYADNGTVVSFHLVITDVMYNDRGVYTCFLSGSNPETRFDLTVEGM